MLSSGFLLSALSLLLLLLYSRPVCGDVDIASQIKGSFYIYDWPDYMNDVWPPANASLHPNASYSHRFRGNSGAGGMVDGEIGYFSTWQFAMYQLTMARLRVSPRRTLNPAEATAFIVPFDIGVHSFVDHLTGRVRVAAPHGWRAIEWMKESIARLGGDEGVWRYRGHDHFVLFSITSYQIIGIGAKVFLTQVCQNCSVLTIETTPTLTSRKYYSNKSRKWWYAVPYPSSFHWHEGIRRLPWTQEATTVSTLRQARPFLSIFIGSVDTSTPRSNAVRRVARRDCLADGSGRCLWFDTAHACAGVLNQTDGMLLYRKSVFCLAPTGDSLTRKSLFDSLVAGCIPVIFARATITQYLWHIPPEEVERVSVYIPAQEVIDGSRSFLEVLRNISDERVLEMQSRIARLAPQLQYSVVPAGYGASEEEAWRFFQLERRGYRWSEKRQKERGRGRRDRDRERGAEEEKENNSNNNKAEAEESEEEAKRRLGFVYRGKIWSPPFVDAVDVMVERMLNRSTIEPVEGFTHEQALAFARLRDEISTEDPDYVALTRISDVLANRQVRGAKKRSGYAGAGKV